MQNENLGTFNCLFEKFLLCLSGKAPISVITDQEKAMKEVVRQKFPLANHRNCLFYLLKKAQDKARRIFATRRGPHAEFHDIIINYQAVAEFETRWPQMIEKHQVQEVKYFKAMWKRRR